MRLFPRPEYPPRAVLEDTALTSPFPKVRKVALLELRIDLRPNCSLTPAAARVFFASICTFSFSVALFFTLQGFWPVLLCWALEMLALGFALYSVMQRRFYTQTVLVTESRISLVTRSPAGEAKQEFARHWAKVKLRSPRASRHPSRLMIESHGRAFEVGSFLNEEERRRLASRLRGMVGGMNESPPLETDVP
jgi:uncharacterized membrane protein